VSYFIRWRFTKDSPRVHGSEPFQTRDAALASACFLLKSHPHSIWVETPDGTRIEVDEVVRSCRAWGEDATAEKRRGPVAA